MSIIFPFFRLQRPRETTLFKRVDEIALDDARTDKVFYYSGRRLRVVELDGTASIRLNAKENELKSLSQGDEISQKFTRFYLTNTAQSGKKLKIEIELIYETWKSAIEFLAEKMMTDPYQEIPKMGGERNITGESGTVERKETVPSGKVWRVFAASVASSPARDVDVDIDNGESGADLDVVTLVSSAASVSGMETWSGEIYLKAGWNIKAHWYSVLSTDTLYWGFVYTEKDVS